MKRLILSAILLSIYCVAYGAPAVNPFSIPDAYGGNAATYLRPVPTWVDQISLDGTNNTDYTVPPGVNAIILGTNCTHFYTKFGGSAVVPAAGITDGSGSSADPTGFVVSPGEVIGFISSAACYVTVDAYKLH